MAAAGPATTPISTRSRSPWASRSRADARSAPSAPPVVRPGRICISNNATTDRRSGLSSTAQPSTTTAHATTAAPTAAVARPPARSIPAARTSTCAADRAPAIPSSAAWPMAPRSRSIARSRVNPSPGPTAPAICGTGSAAAATFQMPIPTPAATAALHPTAELRDGAFQPEAPAGRILSAMTRPHILASLLVAAALSGAIGYHLGRQRADHAARERPAQSDAATAQRRSIASRPGAGPTAPADEDLGRQVARASADPVYLQRLLARYRGESEPDRKGAVLAILQGVANQDVQRFALELASSPDPSTRRDGLALLSSYSVEETAVR